ncbi:hypothetical protein [Stratiformator vulcanicus]|uniref:Uncharacterized protein n=1 Tax=Stratiformator vulcanicus TaxID=2527980 RepID=A0A517R777_9PLAN|nr:hypothetical protein [Stratiformator vulcanicus]QDT39738.1 hypothetical protein Pan189_41470 [Stratiformator vulcanicus]
MDEADVIAWGDGEDDVLMWGDGDGDELLWGEDAEGGGEPPQRKPVVGMLTPL